MANPNSYECESCGATFDSKDQLDGHTQREHQGQTARAGSPSKGAGKEWSETGSKSGGNPGEKSNR